MSVSAAQQITDWLEKLALGQYAQCFAENEIDFSILGDLTDQDLEKIGVAPLGHRRKLLRAIAELSSVEKSTPAVTAEGAALVAPQPRDAAERRPPAITCPNRCDFKAPSGFTKPSCSVCEARC